MWACSLQLKSPAVGLRHANLTYGLYASPVPPHPALSLQGRGFYKAIIKGKDRSGIVDAPKAGVRMRVPLAKPIPE